MRRRFGLLLVLGAIACNKQPFTIDVPLRVVAVTPSGDGVDVAREATVEITFSEDVTAASATSGDNVYLEEVTDPMTPRRVAGTLAYDPTTLVARLTLGEKLGYSTSYRVTITTGIARVRDGGRLPTTVTATFRTLDPPALRVVATQPGAGAAGVARDAAITIQFSEPVRCATVSAGLIVVEAKDLHPHTAGADRDVTGQLACVEPPDIETTSCVDDQGMPNGFCAVVLTPDQSFDWSSHVTVTLRGGTRAEGAIESFRATAAGGQLPEDHVFAFHVADPPALLVTGVRPGDGSEGVDRQPLVEITFSEPPDCATVSAATITIEELLDPHPRLAGTPSPRPVAGALACTPGSEVVSFTPAAPLEWSSILRVTLAGGAATPDQAPPEPRPYVESARATTHAGTLSAPHVVELRAKDPPPLAVIATAPSGSTEDATLGAPIELRFSEPLNCATVNASTLLVAATLDAHPHYGGGPLAVIGAVACAADTVTFTPATAWPYSATIDVTVVGGAFDAGAWPGATVESAIGTSRGGQLPADIQFSFLTTDPPPLLVVAAAPAPSTEDVTLGASLAVEFSQPLDCATVNLGTVAVTETRDAHPHYGGSTTAVAGMLACAGDTLTFVPAAPFAHSSTIAVTLGGGAYDPAAWPAGGLESAVASSRSGQLPADVTYTFLAADPPPLAVTATSPSGAAAGVALDAGLAVTFSEPVDCATIGPATFGVTEVTDAGAGITHACAFTCAGAVVTCDPAADFGYASDVTVALAATVESARASTRGGTLPGPVTFGFHTRVPPALAVVATSPSGGATGVAGTATVQVVFDQPIDPASVTGASFLLRRCTDAGCTAFVAPDPVPATLQAPPATPPAKAVLVPAAALALDAWYQVTLTTALRSAVANTEGGNLPADFVFTFRTAASPPLIVEATNPPNGATDALEGANVTVTFSNNIFEASLTSDAVVDAAFGLGTGDGDTPNLYLRKKGTAVKLPATLSYNAGTRTATIDPLAPLDFNTTYEIVATRDIVDVGSQRMAATFVAELTTRLSLLVDNVDPGDGATGVPVNASVVVTFSQNIAAATVDARSFYLTFQNDFGETVVVPGTLLLEDVVTPDADPNTIDRATFTPALEQYACLDATWPLRYSTAYTVRLASTVTSADGVFRLTGGVTTTFTTGPDPLVAAIRSEGVLASSIEDRDLLAGVADEVPVNSTFIIEFTADMTAAGANGLVGAGNIALFDTQNTPSLLDDTPVAAAVVAPTARRATLTPAANLLYAREYRLVVQGRDSGDALELHDALGQPLQGVVPARFRTSPAIAVVWNPPAAMEMHQNTVVSAIVTRRLDPPALSDATFAVAIQRGGIGCPMIGGATIQSAGLIAYDEDTLTVNFQAIPVYKDADCITATLTPGVRDFLGNPLPAPSSHLPAAVAGTDNSPNNVPASGFDPLNGAVGVPGDKIVTVEFGAATDPLGPFSLKSPAIRLVAVATDAEVPAAVTYDPAALRAAIRPTGFLDAGLAYRIEVTDRVADAALVPITAPAIAPVFTVETTLPAVMSAAPSGTGVAVTAAMVVTFSEPMRPSTVSATSLLLEAGVGPPVPAQITLDAARTQATLTPLAPLAGNATYTLTIVGGALGVADSAGNRLATTVTQTFTTESVRPRVTSLFPAAGGAADVALTPAGAVAIDFSEAVDPATLVASTTTSTGTARLTWVDACGAPREVLACVSSVGGTMFLNPSLDPTAGDPLYGDTTYSLALDAAVITDLGGLLLDLAASTPAGGCPSCPVVWPAGFTTSSADPVVSCALPANGATGVPTPTSVELRFNEPVNPATVAGAFQLYGKLSGALVAVGAPALSGGNTVATFTPLAPLAASTTYVAVLARTATDAAGNPLRAVFASEFTTGP